MNYSSHNSSRQSGHFTPKWSLKIWIYACLVAGPVSCVYNTTADTAAEKDKLLPELGQALFFDNRLSFNQTKSCSSCHDPKFAFTDGYRRSITTTGDKVLHNAPSLINISYHNYFDWANPAIESLLKQSDRPLFSISPIEMGATGHESEILQRLQLDPLYTKKFNTVFSTDENPFSFLNVKKALEAYVRSIRSMASPYDKFSNGDSLALSSSAKQGMILFFSDKLKCASCHQPPLFTNASITKNIDSIYFNTGLYNVHDSGSYPATDHGLRTITGKLSDDGKFKTPTLRNINLTAPYSHDGSINSLEEMIDIYQRGGRNINNGPYHGDGRLNPNKSEKVTGFSLSKEEKRQLMDFLSALTDSSILVNPAFQNPIEH